MAKVTKTLNPLHFEDLEPHRFEDLVRQLAYDFRTWRLLEPTGRLGSDDGYDARGFEIVDEAESQETEGDEEKETESEKPVVSDRLWQIQCKREKTITPAKIEKYIDEMIPKGADIPYGVIFSAPCEFSKQTRDVFQQKLREKGVQEFYMWGRADLEDMLIQPKNDNLLFAYFGISLVIRRRTIKSEIRALLATKRKTVKYLGGIAERSYTSVLVRDANDKTYPYIKEGGLKAFREKPKWKRYTFVGHEHNGIRLLTRKYRAYKETDPKDGKLLKWDYTDKLNMALDHEDHWNKDKDDGDANYREYMFWSKNIEEKNRAFFETEAIIPYDRIIEIDNLGDTFAHCPHIFVEVKNGSWFEYGDTQLKPDDNWGRAYPIYKEHEKLRIKYFPKKFPKVKPEPLPPMGPKKTEDEKKKDDINPEFKKLTNDKN